MFSSLNKIYTSISESVSLSPQRVIASYLAVALGEFFLVDPSAVETQLASTQQAHILLQNVAVKPRLVVEGNDDKDDIVVTGNVQEIKFSWEWGSGQTTNFIRNVSLRICGVRLLFRKATVEESLSLRTEGGNNSDSLLGASETPSGGDWKDKYMRMILDHLTLDLDDIRLTFDLPHPSLASSFVIEASGLELVTLLVKQSENSSPPGEEEEQAVDILQRVRMTSLSAHVVGRFDEESSFKVLKPMGYRATIKRVHGRRFLDGIMNGLIVTGEQIMEGFAGEVDNVPPNGVKLYLGPTQLSALLRLQDMFQLVDANAGERKETTVHAGLVGDSEHSSRFVLPIQYICLCLGEQEQDTMEMQLDGGCTIRYATDGSIFSIDGGETGSQISLDGKPFVTTNNSGTSGRAIVDLVRSTIQITPSVEVEESIQGQIMSEATLVRLTCLQDQLERFKTVVQPFADGSIFPQQSVEGSQSTASFTGWECVVNGKMNFLMQLEKEQSFDMTVLGCSIRPNAMTTSSSRPFCLDCGGVQVSANNGGLAIVVPPLSLSSSGPLKLQGTIQAKLPSMKSAMDVRGTINHALSLASSLAPIPSPPVVEEEREYKMEVGSPVDISIPGVLVSIADAHSLYLHNVSGASTMWRCGTMVIKMSLHDFDHVVPQGSDAQLKFSMSDIRLGAIREDGIKTQDSEKLNHLPGLPVALAWGRLDLASNMGVGAELGGGTTCWGGKAFHFIGPSQVELPSLETLDGLRTYAERVIGELFPHAESLAPSKSGWEGFSLPFECTVPSCTISVEKSSTMPSGTIQVTQIVGAAAQWNCKGLTLQGFADPKARIELNSIAASFPRNGGPSIQFDVESASTSFGRLGRPIRQAVISVDGQKRARLSLRELDLLLETTRSDVSSSQGREQSVSSKSSGTTDLIAKIPDEIDLLVDLVLVTSAASLFEGGKYDLKGKYLRASLAKETGPGAADFLCFNAKLDYLSTKTPWGDASLANVTASALVGTVRGPPLFPGVGGIREGFLAIGSFETVDSLGFGKLSDPLHGTRVTISPDEIKFTLDSVQWDLSRWKAVKNPYPTPSSQNSVSMNATESSPFPFIPPIVAKWNSITLLCPDESGEVVSIALKQASMNVTLDKDFNALVGTQEAVSLHLATPRDWAEVCFSAPALQIISNPESAIPFRVSALSIDLASSSFGGLSIHVPSMKSNTDGTEIHVDSIVDVALQHTDTPSRFSDFILQFSDIFNEEVDPLGGLGDRDLLTDPAFLLPSVSVSILDPEPGLIIASNIRVQPQSISIYSMSVEGFVEGSRIKVSSFQSSFNGMIRGSFCFDEATIPDAGELTKSCPGIQFTHANDALSLHCSNAVELNLLTIPASGGSHSSDGGNRNQLSNALLLPFDVHASFSAIRYSAENLGHGTCETVSLTLRLDETVRRLSFKSNVGFATVSLATESQASTSIRGISLQGSIGSSNENFTQGLVPGIGQTLEAGLDIESVNELKLSGVGQLMHPCSFSLVFDGSVVKAKVGSIDWQLYPSSESQEDSGNSFSLPFSVELTVDEFSGWNNREKLVPLVNCCGMQLRFDPLEPTISSVGVRARASEIKYLGMVCAAKPDATFSFQAQALQTFHNLSVSLEAIEVEADFSRTGWSDALEDESSAVLYRLPNAQVSETVLRANLKGNVVKLEDATLYLKPFRGDGNSTSQTVSSHYISVLKERIPFLLTKANVAGCNVGDSLGQVAASAVLNSGMTGAVVGVVGRDAVGAAISRGKSSRSAKESERYHFGDFSRGLAASVTGNYERGDSSTDVKTYVSDNRVRLGAAAGSGVGMALGMAVAGPIGLVAGSLVAGQAAGKMIEKSCGDPKATNNPSAETNTFTETRQGLSSTKANASLQHQTHHYPNDPGQPPLSSTNFQAEDRHRLYPNPGQPPLSSTNFQAEDRHRLYPNPGQPPLSSTNFQAKDRDQLYPHQSPQQVYPGQDRATGQQIHQQTMQLPRYEQRQSTMEHFPQQSPQHENRGYPQQPSTMEHFPAQSQQLAYQPPPQGSTRGFPQQQPASGGEHNKSSYKFGDATRSIISRGKQSRGKDDKASYKFGDFTRGLFS